MLAEVATDLGKQLWVWSISQGFVDRLNGAPQKNSTDPLQALEMVRSTPTHGAILYVLKNFHPFLGDATVVRKLRDAIYHLVSTGSSLFILSPVVQTPRELDKDTTLVECPLPTQEEFDRLIDQFAARYGHQAVFDLDPRTRETMTRALLGLTQTEAENILARALVQDRRLDERDLPLIIREKEQIVKKSGVLEFHPLREGLADIGGLNALKECLRRKRGSFDDAARRFGVDLPKGVLLNGVPGCGKSLTAKAIATAWTMPLLRFDLGKVFGMYVGQSEENVRKAIRMAESVAPSVLWIDEVEKGFAGAGGGDLDSGVAARVFGTFITWLNEKQSPVFVVATANDISRLPPELMRKGRFDEIFFVDLPTAAERAEILAVHLRARRREPDQFDLARLAEQTQGFSGSDIEAVVKAAVEMAYAAGPREPTTEDLLRAAQETLPLSVTMKERIDELRAWARSRARPASTPWEQVPVPAVDLLMQQRRIEL